MKLIVSYYEAQDLIAPKFNVNPNDVAIDRIPCDSVTPQPQPWLPTSEVLSSEAQIALQKIYDEAYNAGAAHALGKEGYYVNKIALIKAIRTIFPNISLKEGKETAEEMIDRI